MLPPFADHPGPLTLFSSDPLSRFIVLIKMFMTVIYLLGLWYFLASLQVCLREDAQKANKAKNLGNIFLQLDVFKSQQIN